MLPQQPVQPKVWGQKRWISSTTWGFCWFYHLKPMAQKNVFFWEDLNVKAKTQIQTMIKNPRQKEESSPFSNILNKCWISSWFQATYVVKYVKYVVSPNCKNHELHRIYCRNIIVFVMTHPPYFGPILQIGQFFTQRHFPTVLLTLVPQRMGCPSQDCGSRNM